MKDFAAIVLNVGSLVLITAIFLYCLPRKISLFFTIALFTVATFIILAINYTTMNLFNIPIPVGLLYLPLYILLFKGNFLKKLFFYFIQVFINNSLYLFTSITISFFIPNRNNLFYLLETITILLLWSFYLVFLMRHGNKVFGKLFEYWSNTEWVLYMTCAAWAWISIFVLRRVYVLNELSGRENSVYYIILIGAIFSIILLFYSILNTHEKVKQQYKADFAKDIIASWENHYKKTDHLLSKYIFNQDEEKKYFTLHFCDNKIIDKLLGWFAHRCRGENINYSFNVVLPGDLPVSDFDICIIVGNLLENAVEACLKVDVDKKIDLSIMLHNEQFVLKVENTCRANTEDVEGTSPGLHSVKLVTERYSGNLYIKSNDNVYTVSVLIPLGDM